jgi:hypothetical protein
MILEAIAAIAIFAAGLKYGKSAEAKLTAVAKADATAAKAELAKLKAAAVADLKNIPQEVKNAVDGNPTGPPR